MISCSSWDDDIQFVARSSDEETRSYFYWAKISAGVVGMVAVGALMLL